MTNPVERIQRFPAPVTQPAAGQDWTLTPTGRGLWRVLSVVATLTTSAAVANRAVAFTADDQTTTYFATSAGSVQAASLAIRYTGFDGSSVSATVGTTSPVDWPSGGLVLYEGHRLRSSTTAIDAADQWSSIAVLVEELPTGRYFLATPVELAQVELW